jgi:hypothetical protein
VLKQDDLVKGQLVITAWRFSQSYNTGGHLAGQMIMSTLANRVRCGWGSWLGVIETIPNHMAENELPPMAYPNIWEPSFVKMLHAVEGIFDGSAADLSKGALYWGSLQKIERDWFRDKVIQARNDLGLPTHPRVADMNDLSFFK